MGEPVYLQRISLMGLNTGMYLFYMYDELLTTSFYAWLLLYHFGGLFGR